MAETRSKLNRGPGYSWKLNLESYFSPALLEKLNEIPASSPAPSEFPTKLKAPDDIMQILHNYIPWETIQDIDDTEHYYHRVLWERRGDDVTADMHKLKELSSILTVEHDRCREVCYANDERAAQPYRDLVDQLPSIKKDPSYKDLTTRSERYMIKRYLKRRGYQNRDVQIQTPQQSLSSHLEVLRARIQNINTDQYTKAGVRWAEVEHLLHRTKLLIKILELVENKSRHLNRVKDLEPCTSNSTA